MEASPHVLLVDDDHADRLRASRILNTCYFRVTSVASAEEALRFLDVENDVKLIVTDYRMPRMSGYDLLREVKESPMLKHIPVVMVFNSDDISYEELDMCLDAELNGYYFKPLDMRDGVQFTTYIF